MKNELKGGRCIDDWHPEDETFWNNGGSRVANRNLWISIPALLLAFSVWVIWSVIVVRMPEVGFKFDKAQLSWLLALPALSGATMRIFYAFLVPIFGGRRWTTISTASLLIPTIWLGFAIQNPDTPFMTFAIIALLCGFGGANFSSSMSNISFFYPKSKQGMALGLNAGLGNLGVSALQFIVPVVIGFSLFGALAGDGQVTEAGNTLYLQNAAFVWVIPIAIMTLFAWFGMNDLSGAKASFKEQSVIFGRQHNWIMCILYLATFGSFIGFSAAFPMVIKQSFPEIDPLKVAFLGPLVGALFRPVGGWLADKVGGARVTFWNYVVMAIAVVAVMIFLQNGNFVGYFTGFMLLFITTGIGNGSTFRMIPVIFRTLHERLNSPDLVNQARKESAAVVGFAGGFAAYGGFFIPKMFGSGLGVNGTFLVLIAFYVLCIALTWWYYSRKNAPFPC
ncbi:NarK family nitrate/nitrite MFS transporter [Moraxella marmotae]|uniref:NarK family nitrate/nitrite MFS transporter n=1 Tax=Moraxella marmotae TaxID=3344520 RepID=UPI0035F2FF99